MEEDLYSVICGRFLVFLVRLQDFGRILFVWRVLGCPQRRGGRTWTGRRTCFKFGRSRAKTKRPFAVLTMRKTAMYMTLLPQGPWAGEEEVERPSV